MGLAAMEGIAMTKFQISNLEFRILLASLMGVLFLNVNVRPVGGSLKAEGFGDGRCQGNHPQAALEAATRRD